MTKFGGMWVVAAALVWPMAAAGVGNPINQDVYGKPCLTYGGSSERGIVTPSKVEHWIRVKNACSRTIDAQACYANVTNNCRPFRVPQFGAVSVYLGYDVGETAFRFTIKEKVDDYNQGARQ